MEEQGNAKLCCRLSSDLQFSFNTVSSVLGLLFLGGGDAKFTLFFKNMLYILKVYSMPTWQGQC